MREQSPIFWVGIFLVLMFGLSAFTYAFTGQALWAEIEKGSERGPILGMMHMIGILIGAMMATFNYKD